MIDISEVCLAPINRRYTQQQRAPRPMFYPRLMFVDSVFMGKLGRLAEKLRNRSLKLTHLFGSAPKLFVCIYLCIEKYSAALFCQSRARHLGTCQAKIPFFQRAHWCAPKGPAIWQKHLKRRCCGRLAR